MIALVLAKYARNCIKANCNCCNNSDISHSMVLDGIEGFTYKASDQVR